MKLVEVNRCPDDLTQQFSQIHDRFAPCPSKNKDEVADLLIYVDGRCEKLSELQKQPANANKRKPVFFSVDENRNKVLITGL